MLLAKKNGLSELLVLVRKWENKTLVPRVCFYCLHLTRDNKKAISSKKDFHFESRIEKEMGNSDIPKLTEPELGSKEDDE